MKSTQQKLRDQIIKIINEHPYGIKYYNDSYEFRDVGVVCVIFHGEGSNYHGYISDSGYSIAMSEALSKEIFFEMSLLHEKCNGNPLFDILMSE